MRLVIGGLGLALLLCGCIAYDDRPYDPQPRGRPTRAKPTPAPGFDPFRKLMRHLRTGMKSSEVFDKLGAPQEVVQIGGGRQKWRYGHPKRLQLVVTFVDGRLRNWEID
jgi:hypothetical protein